MGGILINAGVINYGGTPSIGANTSANRPAAGVKGRLFVDTTNSLLQYDTGSAWTTIGGSGGITGSGVLGQVTFWTGTSAVSGDNTFFWDNTNKRLGLGTVTPGVRLDIHGTGVLQQLNGTTTNSAFLDFQNAGTTRFRIGNDYNGGTQMFAILNNSTSNYFISGVQSNNRMMFNSSNLTSLNTAQFEFYHFGGIETIGAFLFANTNQSVNINTYKTRGTTKGSYSSTLTGDNLGGFNAAGSDNTSYLGAGGVVFIQNGSIVPSTGTPTDILLQGYNTAGTFQTRLRLYNAGYSQFLDRVNVNNATDNALFELNNNGNLYTGGISPTIATQATSVAMTRTQTGYVCTATLTLTLPAVSGLNNFYIVVANTGATVTVQRAGTDTILDKTGASVTSVTVAAGTRSMFYVGGGSITYQIF